MVKQDWTRECILESSRGMIAEPCITEAGFWRQVRFHHVSMYPEIQKDGFELGKLG